MTVYSPSQTSEWMKCPIKRALRKEGWIVKSLAKKDTSALLGNAFAAGIGVYNNLRQVVTEACDKMPPRMATAAREQFVDASWSVAQSVISQRLSEWAEHGLVDNGDEGTIDKIANRARHAITTYIMNDPLPDNWSIVSVEENLGPEYGNARPDLIVRDSHGLAIYDYKTKLTLAAQYRSKTIAEYANSHQMLHYAWAVGRMYDELVTNYYIGLAVFEPRWIFDSLVYPVHPETLQVWQEGMEKVIWPLMEREDNGECPPYMSDKHWDNFGQCEFYKACFNHHYDEALMAQDYIKLGR